MFLLIETTITNYQRLFVCCCIYKRSKMLYTSQPLILFKADNILATWFKVKSVFQIGNDILQPFMRR